MSPTTGRHKCTNYRVFGAVPIVHSSLYRSITSELASISLFLVSLIQSLRMSGNAFLKAVCRHLPLLRGPLLINNTICLVLSVLSFSAIYLPQLIFIAISFLISLFDFLRYSIKKRASRQSRSDIDQDIHAPGFVVAVDGVLSVLLLAIWIIGVVAFSSWRPKTAIIATFGAFIAWYDRVFFEPARRPSTDFRPGHSISSASPLGCISG